MTDIDREEDEKVPKRREDLVPEKFPIEGEDGEVEAFPIADALIYLGMKRSNFNQMLNRLREDGRPLYLFMPQYDSKFRYVLKRDLDALRTLRKVEE